MMRETIIICTIDLVFVEIIKRILEDKPKYNKVMVLNAFSELSKIPLNNSVKLIIVDDPIIGTSSYELTSYLRLHLKIACPIVFCGTSEHDGKRKAIMSGANYFVNKPFIPKDLSNTITGLC